ncbi:DUF6056 family protein [Acetanaerobacterium elongatum]|uniref:Glucosyl transferase GtrII n=1 Tax=Acetanaerobacterium elongatum TaxID=258515 RepID=A0A1H0G7L7_9FIRM|nr:DUF6056 family protein [Acetanaerobacterium elongatum]SDO02897.1 hypothetical protein SAMN05192585_14815 [Acetanaerobacterium elongatum]
MEKLLNRKIICWIVLVIFLISLIPMLVISLYNHPCADDYAFGSTPHKIWEETGSIVQTTSAAFNVVRETYQNWQGSFFAVFLMSLQPAIFNQSYYSITAIILITLFVLSYLLLFKVVLIDFFKTDWVNCILIFTVVTFLSIQFIYSPVQAFYWYNGAMYYTGFHSLSILLISLLLLSGKPQSSFFKSLIAVLSVLLSFMIGGGNFVTALTTSVIVFCFVIYRIFFQKAKWLIPVLSLISISSGLLISILAPGNAIRQQYFHQMQAIPAILMSFVYAFLFMFNFIKFPVYIGLACVVPLIYQIAKSCNFSFRLPGLVSIVLYGVYASSFTPNLYSMSSFGMERVLNVNQYLFILFFLLLIFYWCGWISKKTPQAAKTKHKNKTNNRVLTENGTKRTLNTTVVGVEIVLVFSLIISCSIHMDVNPNYITSISAFKSLITNEAYTYHQENLDRFNIYNDSSIKEVKIKPFSKKPYVLYFDDCTNDIKDWRNKPVAAFYNKTSVQVIE